uniref:EGF-like domain-containing protein n=1 Tax=Macrostomum lignano TaxID=282301 RepID=A0A1I8JHD1_9PLAT
TCYNGGTCNNYTASPPCLCPLPYIAPYCSAAADYCFTLQPDKGITELPVCLNGGTCTLAYTDPNPLPFGNCSSIEPKLDSGSRIKCDVTNPANWNLFFWHVASEINRKSQYELMLLAG